MRRLTTYPADRHADQRRPRRGAVLLVVLVCLFALGAIGASLLRLAVTEQRTSKLAQRQLQAEWLAAAGLRRAALRAQAEPAWKAETWRPAAEMLPWPAVVTLRRIDATSTADIVVEAVAQYPSTTELNARVSRRRTIPAVTSSATEGQP
jgi:Tfp pilus assembly protein PilX